MFNINSETVSNLKNKLIETKLEAKSSFFEFRNNLIEDELKRLGFLHVTDEPLTNSERYVRYDDEHKYTHVVELCYKKDGRHILQSYARENFARDNNGIPIGNACVGLTYTELMAFTMKMRLLGLES